MFYRIINNKIYDYADYEYATDCLYTDLCTTQYYDANKDFFDVKNGQILLIDNINTLEAKKRQESFEKEFFETSLGWIRRKVTMKDGSIKDFLSDLLLPIKAGIESGQNVDIITYLKPDFEIEPNEEYIKSLQVIKQATPEFIQECLYQTVQDFGLNKGGGYGI